MAKREKSAKVVAISNLIAANKETKSLSGVIKLVSKFWASGYREAFAFVNIGKLADLKIETITKDLHASCYQEGKVIRYVKVAQKDAKGNFIMTTKNGKQCKTYELTAKVVERWTPRILFDVLLASKEAKSMEATASVPSGKHQPSKGAKGGNKKAAA